MSSRLAISSGAGFWRCGVQVPPKHMTEGVLFKSWQFNEIWFFNNNRVRFNRLREFVFSQSLSSFDLTIKMEPMIMSWSHINAEIRTRHPDTWSSQSVAHLSIAQIPIFSFLDCYQLIDHFMHTEWVSISRVIIKVKEKFKRWIQPTGHEQNIFFHLSIGCVSKLC